MREKTLLISAAIVAVTCLASITPAQAALVQLEGDLGTPSWTGVQQPLGPGVSIIEPFSVTTQTGSLTGEVHAENLGNAFDLTVTNLVYEASADGVVPNAHSIEFYVGQEYQSTPGTYTAEHELTGTADLAAGQSADVGMQTTHNFSGNLPGIFDSVAGPGTGIAFNAGPASQVVTTGNIYVIETWVSLSFYGGFASPATITLPASAHTTATVVPEPAAGSVLLGGMMVLAARRRNKRRMQLRN
ncbi:MAG: hypothetical protein WD294_12475 [Phycisphaeraceae bacterium]